MICPFEPNDWVVYTREKYSLSPGPRAKNIEPARHGEMYSYEVDKYWIVRGIDGNDLILETRRGKRHQVPCSDMRLRKATLWERWFNANRFPPKDALLQPTEISQSSPTVG